MRKRFGEFLSDLVVRNPLASIKLSKALADARDEVDSSWMSSQEASSGSCSMTFSAISLVVMASLYRVNGVLSTISEKGL